VAQVVVVQVLLEIQTIILFKHCFKKRHHGVHILQTIGIMIHYMISLEIIEMQQPQVLLMDSVVEMVQLLLFHIYKDPLLLELRGQ
jgi:hypothetical protein